MGMLGARTRAGRLIPAVSTGEAPSSALPPGETHVTPQLNYDLSTLQPLPPYDIPSLHSPIWGAQPTLPRRTRTPVLAPPQPEPPSSSCTLVTPTGNYHAPHAIALFQPQMARALSSAIGVLNRQGIIPTMPTATERRQCSKPGAATLTAPEPPPVFQVIRWDCQWIGDQPATTRILMR